MKARLLEFAAAAILGRPTRDPEMSKSPDLGQAHWAVALDKSPQAIRDILLLGRARGLVLLCGRPFALGSACWTEADRPIEPSRPSVNPTAIWGHFWFAFLEADRNVTSPNTCGPNKGPPMTASGMANP